MRDYKLFQNKMHFAGSTGSRMHLHKVANKRLEQSESFRDFPRSSLLNLNREEKCFSKLQIVLKIISFATNE